MHPDQSAYDRSEADVELLQMSIDEKGSNDPQDSPTIFSRNHFGNANDATNIDSSMTNLMPHR